MPARDLRRGRGIRDLEIWAEVERYLKAGKNAKEIAGLMNLRRGTVGGIIFKLRLENPDLPQAGKMPRPKRTLAGPREGKPKRVLPESPPVAYSIRSAAKELGLDPDDLLAMVIRREVPSVSVVGACRYAIGSEVLEALKIQLGS